jgi:hypothetical protein
MAKAKPKGKGKAPRTSFSVRLDEEERSALAGAAENEQREAASLARLIIREGLKARGFLK